MERARLRRTRRQPHTSRTQEPPQATEGLSRLLLDAVVDYAIVMLDLEGYVVAWSAGAEQMKGYTTDEAIGLHLSAFLPPDEVDTSDMLLDTVVRQGRAELEGWRVRKDGTLFWAHVIVTPVHDAQAARVGFAIIARDLTRGRAADEALRQSEERFRLLVESVRDYAIFLLDPTGRVATWNPGAERIKGYKPHEIIGSYFARFYTEEDAKSGKCEMELEVAARDGRFEDEGWRVRKDGSRFWANVVITALREPSGKLVGFAKITRDLTERREAEQERLRLTQAQEAIRLRDEFLSIASHELNTPLTTTKMQVESLLARTDLDPKVVQKIARVGQSVTRLSQLIDTLLDVSRIATGRFALTLAPADLVTVARETVERMQDVAAKARCSLTFTHRPEDGAIEGEWDALRVEQVVTNLVGNSIKYAAGTPIVVDVRREGQDAVLRVTDRGPGIAAQDLERIFGRFERAAPMRHFGGLGLGLYVSREIVEAHGGTISADAPQGSGARVTARLPLAPRGGRS